jgi:hypothetical protein
VGAAILAVILFVLLVGSPAAYPVPFAAMLLVAVAVVALAVLLPRSRR